MNSKCFICRRLSLTLHLSLELSKSIDVTERSTCCYVVDNRSVVLAATVVAALVRWLRYRLVLALLECTRVREDEHLIAATAAPILCQGDVLGLVLFAAGEGELPGESEYKLAQIVAAFLGRHMEA